MVELKIKRLNEKAKLPSYSFKGEAGLDLYAIEDYLLKPGERRLFKLGFAMELPLGYVALIWDRSGLAKKHGIKTMGGVIDPTYRGEVGVILLNTSNEPFEIKEGDRIAQMLIQKVEYVDVVESDELSETERGAGGFGSTGR